MNAACGNCEGQLFMLTCHHAHGTGHEWTLASVCVGCREVYWIESGCPDCRHPDRFVPASLVAQATKERDATLLNIEDMARAALEDGFPPRDMLIAIRDEAKEMR